MDLSLLPTSTSEYNKERTGARFTVRSANSPSYTWRPGVRKYRGFLEEEREGTKEVGERERYGTHTGTNGTKEENHTVTGYQARTGSRSSVRGQSEETDISHKMSTKLNQNGSADKTITEFGTDRSGNCNPASESRGRTDSRRFIVPNSRTKSLDRRARERSPDWGKRPDMFMLSTKRGEDIRREAGNLDERRTGVEGARGRVSFLIQAAGTSDDIKERSTAIHMSQDLDRTSRDRSLPSRFRSYSRQVSDDRGTSTSIGSKGGQSILERIEKLYGSAGFGQTEDSTPDFLKQRSYARAAGGRKEREGNDLVENERKETDSGNKPAEDSDKYSRLKSTLEIPLNGGAQKQGRNFYIDETDFSKISSPEETSKRPPSSLLSSSGDTSTGVEKTSGVTSPVSDEDDTPINTPSLSPLVLSPTAQPENTTPIAESTPARTQAAKTPKQDSPPLLRPLATTSHSDIPDLISPDVKAVYPNKKKPVLDLEAWVAGLNTKIKVWNDDEDDYEDDDESTQKDEDSNYDSDSGESSVTITSNMSQSDRRSFSVSLSDLCNFAGVDYESENDSDEWQPTGRRSASLSSEMSALSCVSVMPSEELDRLLEDVRSLGDNNLKDYDDVQVVVLHKEMGVGLGFSVAGGVDQNKPVTVHKVFHSGVAAQEGSIREGDQVLSINGTSLCGFVHWEALRVLRRAKARELGVVVLRRGGISSTCKGGAQANNAGPTQTQQTGQRLSVCLEKNNRDLGFSLEGGLGSSLENRPITVQKIFQGGPVDKVCPGDEVLEIEGVSTVGMRRLEAWTLIRKLPPGPVEVVLRRPLKHPET
uniref:Interleukin 16 n=1 Tax=Larimichthys crocea TaxID=215358 RepID=A0A2I6QF80_LARCR|nr:interleukin 16 [Larimichthys crocea]